MWLNSIVSRVGWWCPLEVPILSAGMGVEGVGIGWGSKVCRGKDTRKLLKMRDRCDFRLEVDLPTHQGVVRPGTLK